MNSISALLLAYCFGVFIGFILIVLGVIIVATAYTLFA